MRIKEIFSLFRTEFLPGILNSYSIIFFLDNKILAGTIMVVSFFNFWAGLSGLLAVILALFVGHILHFDKTTLRSGLYSFNALLTGIGMGTFFDPGVVYFSLLALAALFTFILSVTLGGAFYQKKLPFLSIPFVITFWFMVLPSSHFQYLGLTQRSIFWMNEMYAVGGNSLLKVFQTIDSLQINKLIDIYLRSVSSVFFQDNLIAGLLITVAILYSSRIMFSLSVVGFLSAYIFAHFTGSEAASINYYNIGANYMMVAFAVGGYFLIPSKQSYLWTILLIPLTSLVLLFFYKLFGFIQLPVFSLPFAFVTILFIYFLQLRTKAVSLILTPLQLNSPEKNLYAYNNNKERLARWLYFPLYLPFTGEWLVTQGHDDEFTHKGEWGKAFDFMIAGRDSKTYRTNGQSLNDYYCYNKPVFAPADGYVEMIADHIDDNEPGKVNTTDNWGNSITIRHINDVYTQISHLRKGSFKVFKGEFVRRGDLLAHCGNSGRSPEPHVHFQVQSSPAIGSRTLDYPFAYYFKQSGKDDNLQQFAKPIQGDVVSSVNNNPMLFKAFDLMPDSIITVNYNNGNTSTKTQAWQVGTDAYNSKYLYCKETNSTVYFMNDGIMFYFTGFYGNKNSLLYYFYLSAYKIFLGSNEFVSIEDTMPLSTFNNSKLLMWLQDFLAPFYTFMSVMYKSEICSSDNALDTGMITIGSVIQTNGIMKKHDIMSSSLITIDESGIAGFEYSAGMTKIKAACTRH